MNYIWNPEGERIASELIPKYHEHLQKVKIAYLFKAKPTAVEPEGAVDTPKKRGRPRKTHAPGKNVCENMSLRNFVHQCNVGASTSQTFKLFTKLANEELKMQPELKFPEDP